MGKDKNAGLYVEVYDNEDIDRAIKRLKKKIKKANLMTDLFASQFYRKPSDVKREKLMKAKIRNKYKLREDL